jgi:4-hydroxy-tetrahydrodipicolinate reductase
MIKLAVFGCNGKMGNQVVEYALEDEKFTMTAGIDYKNRSLFVNNTKISVFDSLEKCNTDLDVVIDFSDAPGTLYLLEIAKSKKIPLVIATSGLEKEHFKLIQDCIKTIPVFQAANMSVGIHLLKKAIKQLSADAGEHFDIEIVEKYHRLKKDSPSGTAISLASAIAESLPWTPEYNYGRYDKNKLRIKNEIGIHSVRGGSIIGEYDIIFAGQDEVLQFSHKAYSRSLFALGALKAAAFIVKQKPGLYHMDDLF